MKNCLCVSNEAMISRCSGRPAILGRLCKCLLVFFATFCTTGYSFAQVRLASNIQDQMVVQRGAGWEVSGTSDDDESFEAKFAGQTIKVQPYKGQWRVRFEVPQNLSGPSDLIINKGNQIRRINVGDVWFCSGQSNMALGIQGRGGSDKDQIKRLLQNKTIRVFQVHKPVDVPQPDAGRWLDASSEQVRHFSAVCLAFGASLYNRVNVPIGLIDASLSGTWIESWISSQSLNLASSVRDIYARYEKTAEKRKLDNPRKLYYGIDKPSELFELMVRPQSRQAIKGVLWYQGEGNTWDAEHYAELLSLLIKDWRMHWGDAKLPFIIMQLPRRGVSAVNFDKHSKWALLRDAQRVAVTSNQPAGLAVTIDLGDGTIHPGAKLPFGQRAASVAFVLGYERRLQQIAPLPTQISDDTGAIRIVFDKGQACLNDTGHQADTFFVAGEDRIWHSAKFEIGSSYLRVSSSEVPNPRAVRYAWSDYPVVGLLTCEGGVPVTPFRSDDWTEGGN